jgi:uncharacterized membrane protein
MYAFAKWLYLMALIVWIGEVVFFSFVVAPGLFRTFPTEEAGRAVGAIFPMYYRLGYVCGVIVLLTSGVLVGGAVARGWWSVNVVLATIMLAATLYAGVVIQPRATALRPQLHAEGAAPTVKEEFDRLHHLAVQLNGAVLLCGVAVSIITSAALRP